MNKFIRNDFMKADVMKTVLTQGHRTLILASVFCLLMFSKMAYSNEQLSQFSALKVQAAHQLQQQNKVDKAILLLEKITPVAAYDQAFIQRMLGIFYWQQENTEKAIISLQQAVQSDLLTGELGWYTQRMLADILLAQLQYKAALSHYEQLIASITTALPAAQHHQVSSLWLRIAQTHYQLQQWSHVLTSLDRYQTLSSTAMMNKEAQQYLTLKLAAERHLLHWEKALLTLNRLLQLEPNKISWWQQTASIQLRLGREQDSLNTLALARHQGIKLSAQELKTLAQLYARLGMPERAALLTAELMGAEDNVALLVEQAIYWQRAKEWNNALTIWEQASQLDSKHSWPFAQLLLQQGFYSKALIALKKADKLDPNADIELAKVHAYYQLKNFDDALVHAKKAHQISATAATMSWISYLKQVKNRES